MKKFISTIIAVLFVLTAAACSNAAASSKPQSWTGTWQTSDKFLSAEIAGNNITINIVDQENEETSLYWKGSWDSSAQFQKGTTVLSKADTAALDASLMGSQDSSKQFTYDGKALTFKFSMLGTTKTMHIRKP